MRKWILPEAIEDILPAEAARGAEPTFVCENPDCDAFGEPV